MILVIFFFFQAEDGIRDDLVTGVQTCALPICWNRIILQATSKGFVVSGLRAAGPGLGSVGILVGSKLRVGHRERGRGRMTGLRAKFAAKPDGANRGRILVACAVRRKRFVGDGHEVAGRFAAVSTKTESVFAE